MNPGGSQQSAVASWTCVVMLVLLVVMLAACSPRAKAFRKHDVPRTQPKFQ